MLSRRGKSARSAGCHWLTPSSEASPLSPEIYFMRLQPSRISSDAVAQRRRHRRKFSIESLEGRALLTGPTLIPIDFGGTVTGTPVAVGGIDFFTATDALHGNELWKSDGSTATLVKDISPGPGSSSPSYL